MKKSIVISLAALALVAFVAGPIMAQCGGCPSQVKANCASAKKAETTETASKMNYEECAARCGISVEEAKKMCADMSKCGFTTISVKGMTCGACESTITTALTDVPGVRKVIKVDHKEGIALVCTDLEKVDQATMVKSVVDKGYQAEIIPAVATTSTVSAVKASGEKKADCATPCTGSKEKTKKTSDGPQ